jgi:glutathione reductase (NADPH)
MAGHDYDLFVIGAGSGGVRAARVAAGHGARVGIAEQYRFGGTCVIRGCVPKKLLVYASRFRDDFEDAFGFGWSFGETRFDWRTLIANKDREIARLEGVYRGALDRVGVTIFEDRAELEGTDRIRLVRHGKLVTAKYILIATGATPVIPDILFDGGVGAPGSAAELVMTSNDAFGLAELPSSIAIIGGGYIAVEFASIFAGLGSKVTLLYRGEQILRGFDRDLRDGLAEALRARGIDVRTRAEVRALDSGEWGLRVKLGDGSGIKARHVLFATGRSPMTQRLGLETAGVRCGPLGEIVVDAHSRSSVPSIYAVGDVTNRVNLTPVAIREGHAFADSVFGGKPWTVDHRLVPTAVFSTPEVATVGLSEDAATSEGRRTDVYKARFRPLRNALAGRDEQTLMKLVVDAASGRVLGCHVLGPDAAEIVQMAAVALSMGATKAQFDATLALHPSAAEELVTMRDKWTPAQSARPAGDAISEEK